MADELTTLLSATGGAFLGKFVGPAAEQLGKAGWERIQQLGQRATAYLATVGREPKPVEPKILVPLVQAAAHEPDPGLADKWAALLANAADPDTQVDVQPVYADILRQLTAKEVKLLDELFNSKTIARTLQIFEPNYEHQQNPSGIYLFRKSRTIGVSLDLERLRHERGDTGIERSSFESLVDNLLRHRLLIAAREEIPKKQSAIGNSLDPRPVIKKAYFSALGFDFMMACTPPNAVRE
ncbi:Abi-alpha family protein [Hymenobacter sp. GOD-10R]|uniref:Abi-alpha family protein n=1 Tax=Hymenobacter sp. GOD-10R TaxID=3093922 RepID=UPI002D7A1BD0|nr:Abi-alpha family protein [Hymenobacter sp. GOD-10R]WRQ29157.1 Abi-alpha family protein [Hymenobacter sp. GOD-10R]